MSLIGAVTGASYGPNWVELAQELADLAAGKPTPNAARIKAAARFGDPIENPFPAVFCEDWNVPVRNAAELEVYRRALTRVAPDMKLSPLGWGATLACIGWPAKVNNPQHRLKVHGAPPILALNSRYDPATPYQWATNAAGQMGAVLLTYDGWGHGAYFKDSACVVGATDTYLITGKAPARGTHCPAVEPPTGPTSSRVGPALPVGPRPGTPGWF
jgi:hypothetical protein